jgi:hypothetical protein
MGQDDWGPLEGEVLSQVRRKYGLISAEMFMRFAMSICRAREMRRSGC